MQRAPLARVAGRVPGVIPRGAARANVAAPHCDARSPLAHAHRTGDLVLIHIFKRRKTGYGGVGSGLIFHGVCLPAALQQLERAGLVGGVRVVARDGLVLV